VPADGKTEVRYKGPNITPGYWRAPRPRARASTRRLLLHRRRGALDRRDDVHQGLKFDGRIAEDFKLATGTFVSVGPMRAKIIAAGAPYVQDAVITGINLKEVGALIFPTPAVRSSPACPTRAAARGAGKRAGAGALPARSSTGWRRRTGSANRVARLHLMHEPPSIDKGEVTDKGSINQRAVLKHREAMVDALHDGTPAVHPPTQR
jgi:feruloyl-CoA synthase